MHGFEYLADMPEERLFEYVPGQAICMLACKRHACVHVICTLMRSCPLLSFPRIIIPHLTPYPLLHLRRPHFFRAYPPSRLSTSSATEAGELTMMMPGSGGLGFCAPADRSFVAETGSTSDPILATRCGGLDIPASAASAL